MSTSKLMAQHFAIDLSSMTLGMWETARLLRKRSSKEQGLEKLKWLRTRIMLFKRRAALGDSLRIYLNEEFNPNEYDSLLDSLEKGKIEDAIPQIEKLIEKTQGYINEARRTRSSLKGTV